MQIILMRHGEPRMERMRWLSPADMALWIAHYNRSVVEARGVPDACIRAAAAAAVIVASTAPRALSSVHALGRLAAVEDAVFIEAGLPCASWHRPRLPAPFWAVLFRLLWFCGYARGAESLGAAKQRAGTAARRLVELTAQGPVLLLGHGIMNRLIAAELRKLGWTAHTQQGSRYWSMTRYDHQPG